MSRVRRSPRSGQGTAPTPLRLDWGDPAAVAAWARDVSVQARDAIAAGQDATNPPGQRDLGRRAARRIITDASRKLADLLRFSGTEPPR